MGRSGRACWTWSRGRSKKAYADWLTQRGEDFSAGVEVATLDPFHGYKAAIDDELAEATVVLDVFHVVALGTKCVDEVPRRVQQATTGHRGRKGDPLYGIQNILRAGEQLLETLVLARPLEKIVTGDRHVQGEGSPGPYLPPPHRGLPRPGPNLWSRRGKVRHRLDALTDGDAAPLVGLRGLGRTLSKGADYVLAYFDRPPTSNGPTEAARSTRAPARPDPGFRNLTRYIARALLEARGFRP